MLRTVILLFAVAALVSCRGVEVGPDPIPGVGFRGVAHVSGDFDAQTFADATPTSALVRGHGKATITARVYPPPFLVIDGEADLIVEPLPGREQEAMQAVREGHVLIRRAGVPGDLNAPGSRAAKIASLVKAGK